MIYRWALASYFIFVLALSIATAEGCKQLDFYGIYLTNWNVVLNASSSLLGAVLVAMYYKGKMKFGDDSKSMTSALKVYWLLSTLSTVVSVSLSCVYWPLIYTGKDKGLNDSLTHAGNAIVLIVDIFVNGHQPRYGHFIYPLSFGVFYAFVFSLPYTVLGGTDRYFENHIYAVLDWTNNSSGAFTFASLTIFFLTFMHFVLTSFGHTRIHLHRRIKSRQSDQSAESTTNHQFDNPSFSP